MTKMVQIIDRQYIILYIYVFHVFKADRQYTITARCVGKHPDLSNL